MSNEKTELLTTVDHLVFGTPELNRGIQEIERLTGIRALAGGQHPGWGTHNALLSLGPMTYLEIIAPDPAQPAPKGSRIFGLDVLSGSKLVTWAAKASDLNSLRNNASRCGVHLGEVRAGKRQRDDGLILTWESTSPDETLETGLIPFFINWGSTPHPAQSAAQGLKLIGLRAEHPEPEAMKEKLRCLNIHLPIEEGSKLALIATVDGPLGRIELR